MSIASAITSAQAKVAAAYTACNNKGATMPQTQDLSNLPTCIGSIPTGGGGANLTSLSVTPSTSAQQITPTSPVDGYNEVNVSAVTSSIDANITAGNIKKDVSILGVTGTYEGGGGSDPDAWLKDGDTHLWINIVNDYQLAQQIRIRMIGTIDWGDGSTKDTANVTAYTTFTHTYSEKGKYRIDLHPTSGTFYLGGGGNAYNVMGNRTNNTYFRTGVLYQVEIGTDIITELTSYAFYYLKGLQRVYIPKNITTMGQQVFTECASLHQVEFEDCIRVSATNVTNMFYNCYSLQDISYFALKGTSTYTAFRNCYCITVFTLGSTITTVPANAFNSCYGLKVMFCLPTSAPSVANANAFSSFPTDCAIKVPKGSLSSYQGAGTWSSYSSQMSEAGAITMTLTSVTSSNKIPMADLNGSYTTTLTPDSGKTLGTVTVKMGGTDITSTAYSAGVVTIASVTGNIEITASAS